MDDPNFVRLKKQIKESPGSFIAVLGSGLSRPSGMPDWKGLKDKLINAYEMQCACREEDGKDQAEQLRSSNDYWRDFKILKDLLTPLEYEKILREQLSDSGRHIPEAYKMLWQLGIRGVVTFNIDKLVLNAYSEITKTAVDFATALEPVKYMHFPASNGKFVLYPHGYIQDPSSWVFTEDEKQQLYRNTEFKKIMTLLFNGMNLLVIGFNPSEQSFLNLLNDIGFEGRISGLNNYYIGANVLKYTFDSLSKYGFSTISYKPSSESHPEVIQMLSELLAYEPKEVEAPTVYEGQVYTEQDIPDYAYCGAIGVDRLRDILNGVVAGIIPRDCIPTREQLDRLQEFYNTYSGQLHHAWFINVHSKDGDHIHGYQLLQSVGRGAFGNVFEVKNAKGERFALKVLLPEVKDNARYLSCFRRGIRSMNILKARGVSGMVRIEEAFEIPACIVMEFVDGSSLREAIDKRYLTSPHRKLEVIERIATIIHTAHQLEEHILHRDLKPENIMLRNFYVETSDEPIEVVILDFDLSWHKGATELTVAMGAISQGFMAPEQVEEVGALTRNTAVDVYSIGMLAYYILTNQNPTPNEHKFSGFQENMCQAIQENYHFRWKCLPRFLTRAIAMATMDNYAERCPLENFIAHMQIAQTMVLSETLPYSHPMILMELASRIGLQEDIDVGDFERRVTVDSKQIGKTVTLRLDQHGGWPIIAIKISKSRTESDPRGGMDKYLEIAKNKALAEVDGKLFQKKWGEKQTSAVSLYLEAELPKDVSLSLITQLAENIQRIRQKLDLKA